MVEAGKVYEARPTGWSSEGDAVARIQGMAVFVKGGLPGEACRVEVEHVGRRAAWAHVEALEVPAPGRRAPDCPYYGRCGGCQLRHMDYPTELGFKKEKILSALSRLGGVALEELPMYPAQRLEGYRNKGMFPVASGPAIGFYQKGTHRVADVERCLLQGPGAAALRGALKGWMERWGISAYDEREKKGLIRHLCVRENSRGESLCALVGNGKTIPRERELVEALRGSTPGLRGVIWNVNTRDTNVVLGPESRVVWGEDALEESLGGLVFQLSHRSFFQVNRDQTQVLYGLVEEFAGLTGRERVLDLYCGVGTIGLTLAGRAGEVVGVEVAPQAIRDARANGARNGISNARFYAADAAQAAADLARRGERPGLIVVDPPRKGLEEAAVAAIRQLGPKKLIYVSCDPATLGRDVKRLAGDYRVVRGAGVDLFPRTCHVETVILLEKA